VEKIEKSELEAVEKEPSPEEIKIKEQASPDEG
jgi:hypothetical protein